jgi:diaminopimelate decarboxylase
MSWNNSGLGFWAEAGGIRGAAKFSDFYRSRTQYQELDSLLAADTAHHGRVGDFLLENMLELHLEPGRSLLDQVGVTVGRVLTQNHSLQGEHVLFLDMNRTHLNAIELEYMADPFHLPVHAPEGQSGGVYLSGNLCLPHDFLTRRKVFFTHIPKSGDLLAFVNTAGYHMDFTESATALQKTAQKLAYGNSGWQVDDQYEPLMV